MNMANAVIENNCIDSNVKIIYKRPEYLNNALRKHYYKKKNDDPEYLEKEKERARKYREANRDHVNELARIRRQKKKAEEKAKQEKIIKQEIITDNEEKEDLPNLEKLTV
jgi:hypothetical protein